MNSNISFMDSLQDSQQISSYFKLKKILLIDDDPSFLLLADHLMAENNVQCLKARNALEAVEHINAHNAIDAIVTDIFLDSGPSGIEIGMLFHEEYPLVMVSGGEVEEFPYDMAWYCDAFLSKSRVRQKLFEATTTAQKRWHLTHMD